MLGVFSMDNSSGKPKQNICDGANTHRLTPGEHATIPPVSYTQIVCLEPLTLPFWVMIPGPGLPVCPLFQLQCPLCFSMPSTKPPTTTRWKKWLLITEVLPKKGTAEMIHQPIGSNIFIGSHILGGRSSKKSIHITRRSSRDLGDKFSKNSHSKTKKLSDAMKSRAYQLS